MPLKTPQNLAAPASNIDPPLRRSAFDVSAGDYTPTNGELITAINTSTAGVLHLVDIAGNDIAEYFNTGWNPCTASKTIKNNGGNGFTSGVAKLDTTRA